MGGGGSNKIEETEQQKAFADVAMQKWQKYQRMHKPVQDRFMNDVDRRNSENSYQQVANLTAVPVEANFTNAVTQGARQMTDAGFNPQSGLFQKELMDLDTRKQQSKADMVNQGQVSQQNRYVGGLQNIIAMGQGQETQATQGLGELSNLANQRSRNDASMDAQRRFGNQQVVGSLVGAGTRYGIQQSEKSGG